MFSPWTVIFVILAYVAVLFVIGRWAEVHPLGRALSRRREVYALGLAVYCTTWTYYGSVGKAATGGMGFLPVYLGPTLGLLLGASLFKRIVELKHAHRITSIADFVSARYGKSQTVAALVTVVMMVGIVPYVGLQLKAVTSTFSELTAGAMGISPAAAAWFSPMIAVLMTLFTIAFGIRHLDATERHPGMVVTLATESVFKLCAFLAAAFFIVGVAFGDFATFVREFEAMPPELPMFGAASPKEVATWITVTLLSMSAFAFLPRQFHVGVVENDDPSQVATASWMTPLYLLVINIFVVPVALGGAQMAAPGTPGDQYLLAVPLQAGAAALSLAVFVGGFSAAIGMIMISSMTMSTMVSNHLVVPIINAVPALTGLRRQLIAIRWLAAAAFIFAGYGFEVGIGDSYMLVAIGLISFAATAIVATIVLGGLWSRRFSRVGALTGLGGGFLVWAYTLLLPSLVKSGWLPRAILDRGPWGQHWLRPEALFGFAEMPALTHGVVWSVGLTLVGLCIGSVLVPADQRESALTEQFLTGGRGLHTRLDDATSEIDLADKRRVAQLIFGQFFPPERAADIVGRAVAQVCEPQATQLKVVELVELHTVLERELSGAIGAASAHRAMQSFSDIAYEDARVLEREYAKMLAELKLSPGELHRRIDFQAEREALLNEQFQALQRKVEERDTEIDQRRRAELALAEERDRLEERVAARTKALDLRNRDMRLVLDSVGQGFVMIELDGTMSVERSAIFDTWLGHPHEAGNMVEVLRACESDVAEWFELALAALRQQILPEAVVFDQFPKTMALDGRNLEFEYLPIHEDGQTLSKVLVVLSDVTAAQAGALAEERQREAMALFEKRMADPAGFLATHREAESLVQRILAAAEGGEVETLLRDLHTLKGMAALAGMSSIAGHCHQLEDVVQELGGRCPSDGQMRAFARVWQALCDRIGSFLNSEDAAQLRIRPEEQRRVLAVLEQQPQLVELREEVRRWSWEPTGVALHRLADHARQLARQLGKPVPEVVIEDHALRTPREQFAGLWSALPQLVRNAVDHGLEPTEIRVATGKPEVGRLWLRSYVEAGAMVIEVQDDGSGINWQAIAEAARSRGLPHSSRDELVEAMFSQGLSTRASVSQVSGRGLGTDVVVEEVRKLGGRVTVDESIEAGTLIRCTLPEPSTGRSVQAA